MAIQSPMSVSDDGRLESLDGWRGISILLVLACHLLPLGPEIWELNAMAGPMGMALFFTLSGFLITRFLLFHTSVVDFLIRRFFRIVPLAWIGLAFALPFALAPVSSYVPNFLFYANLPPQHLVDISSHYWSVYIEMQFYVGIACAVGILGRRGLYAIPVLCVAITLHRVLAEAPIDIVTWRRADEIFAGGVIALMHAGRFGANARLILGRPNVYILLAVLALCSHPRFAWLNYLRPYVAGLLVGATLVEPPPLFGRILHSRVLAYVAAISFALYVIHHLFMYTWLGAGETQLEKYAKTPLLFAATFLLAHLSTFYFERPLIDFGKRLSVRIRRPPKPA